MLPAPLTVPPIVLPVPKIQTPSLRSPRGNPVAVTPMSFPSTRTSEAWRVKPIQLLPPMTFPEPAVVPPIVMPDPTLSRETPVEPASAAVPLALLPIRFPATKTSDVPLSPISRSWFRFPETTLPDPATVPPIVMALPESTKIPSRFPIGKLPVMSVPM